MLVSLFGKAGLDSLSPRVQCLHMKVMRYWFLILYVPEKHLATADVLSRGLSSRDGLRKQEAMVGSVKAFAGLAVQGISDVIAIQVDDVASLLLPKPTLSKAGQ